MQVKCRFACLTNWSSKWDYWLKMKTNISLSSKPNILDILIRGLTMIKYLASKILSNLIFKILITLLNKILWIKKLKSVSGKFIKLSISLKSDMKKRLTLDWDQIKNSANWTKKTLLKERIKAITLEQQKYWVKLTNESIEIKSY